MTEKLLMCLYFGLGLAVLYGFILLLMPLNYKLMGCFLSLFNQQPDLSPEKVRRGRIAGAIVMGVFYLLFVLIILTGTTEQ